MTTATKITYTSASGDLEEFHRQFETGLALIRRSAGAPGATTGGLARGAAILRLEGIGLDRKRRLRPLLCRAIHAGTEPYGDRGLT
jgi:hypothetical protein